MKKLLCLGLFVFLFSCEDKEKQPTVVFTKYDEIAELEKQQDHEKARMQFKLIQSKYLDMNEVFKPFEEDLAYFSEEDYTQIKPLVIEQDIPTIQQHVKDGKLSYEKLTLFYLYRIRKFESDSTLYLNSIIALNPKVVEQAREKDENSKDVNNNSVYGMPILLKDNINTLDMPTTAGAMALAENKTDNNAFIVNKLLENNALILGKLNLSEWAYFFCSGCPLGYSAIGGQTLNPYGRKVFETGGSSAGSGVATAANFAVATVGTETSGSITSPSSLNSVVGLKPTVGLLSRSGIVPISSTLDTSGPMTKNVTDNAILFNALLGYDEKDFASSKENKENIILDTKTTLKGKKLGILKQLLADSIYKKTTEKLREAGAELVEITPKRASFSGFRTLLSADMKKDLPVYLKNYASEKINVETVTDVIDYNLKDSILNAPYGQALFVGIQKDTTSTVALEEIKQHLRKQGQAFLSSLYDEDLDAILSINNYHSGVAAMSNYPTLTVPMGYKTSGEPISLTFLGKPYSEEKLLNLGYAFEQLTKARKIPENYK
ncbi:amidase family protein [Polaribacter sp.]|nr:amidase family protein [Polaribacter sp.]